MPNFFRVLISFSFLISWIFAYTQKTDFNNYKPLVCEGEIPVEFITLSSEKVKKEQSEISKNYKGKEQKTRATFSLKTNFGIDELLTSGRIIFNDQVSTYIQSVAQYVLRDQPEVFKQLKFYAVRTSSANAFATHNGLIFVNLGLIAQLNTESELAFVLAHEIQHYLKKHSITRYVEGKKIKSGEGLYKKIGFNEKQLAMSRYSKDQESEADMDGLALYQRTTYSQQAPNRVMDVLAFSFLPFDDVALATDFLETKYLKFPDSYHLKETKAIEVAEDEEDENASHPNIAKRRAAIAEKIEAQEGGIDFLFGENEFMLIRKICRYESLEEEISHRNYENAIYNAWLLLAEEPNSFYLKKTIIRGLYGLTKYKNEQQFQDVHIPSEDIQGKSQALYHFFEQFNGEELNALALFWAWDLYKETKNDSELNAILDDLFLEIGSNYSEGMDSYSAEAPIAAVTIPVNELYDTLENENTNQAEKKLTRYEKIKKEKLTITSPKKEAAHIRFTFVDCLKEEEFKEKWDKAKTSGAVTNNKSNLSRAERKKLEADNPQQRCLGAKKVVFMDPIYISLDQRSEVPVRYFDGEEKKKKYISQIKENAGLLGLNYEIISIHSLKPDQVDKFNDFSTMSDWISERMMHNDISRMVSTNHNETKSLIEKYGTPYFAWTGIITVKERDPNLALFYIISIVYPFMLPYAILKTVKPTISTYFFTLVYDLEKSEIGLTEIKMMKKKPKKDYSTALLYRTLDRINSKQK